MILSLTTYPSIFPGYLPLSFGHMRILYNYTPFHVIIPLRHVQYFGVFAGINLFSGSLTVDYPFILPFSSQLSTFFPYSLEFIPVFHTVFRLFNPVFKV